MLPDNEERITPKMACRDPLITVGGSPRSLAWYYRMASVGGLSLSGRRVVLQTEKNTTGKVTTRGAIRRFLAALNDTEAVAAAPAAARPLNDAMSELAAAGIH